MRLAVLLAAALLTMLSAGRAQDAAFLSQIPDLPLMPGLEEVPGAGMVFDKPNGRIVEAFARGPVQLEAVVAFYRQTLPQLGWSAATTTSFRREGERLVLDFQEDQEVLTLRFTLKPD